MSRRDFLISTAASAAVPLCVRARTAAAQGTVFQHGVASGDPLTDRVILWTRVTSASRSASPVQVRWQVATDEAMRRIVARGTATASAARDFTVKVDAGSLRPGGTYFYAFDSGGEQSPIGRTRTLPANGNGRLRLAAVSCSNYPAGYFNVFRCVANRDDLDAVVHLGDYIYEVANGVYGDGTATNRIPAPAGETVTLADYRLRYGTYHPDVDLQEARRLHPFIVVWDDHEIANDASAAGAPALQAKQGRWATRRAGAYQAYLEWMPVREAGPGVRLYRRFRFGDLADLVMLDTRGLRDPQVSGKDFDALVNPRRTLLGAAQEAWLRTTLRDSQRGGTRWRLLGQQVIFAPLTIPGIAVQNTDVWDGYPAARRRVFDMLAAERITDLAILSGDVHSSWAMDVPRPDSRYNARTGEGSAAVELVTPAISSPPMFASETLRERGTLLRLAVPHLKYLEGDSRGYVVVDVSRERLQADWYHVPGVDVRSASERKATSYVCERGAGRLAQA